MGGFSLPKAGPRIGIASLAAGSSASSSAIVSPGISTVGIAAASTSMTLNQATVVGNSISMPPSDVTDVHSTGWMDYAAFSSYVKDLIPDATDNIAQAWADFDGGAQGGLVFAALYYNVQSFNGTFLTAMVSHTPNSGGKQYALIVKKTGSPRAAYTNYPNSNNTILTQGTVSSGGATTTTGFTKAISALSTASGTATAMLAASNAGKIPASGAGTMVAMPQQASVLGPKTASGVQGTPNLADSDLPTSTELSAFEQQLADLRAAIQDMAADAAAALADVAAAAVAEDLASRDADAIASIEDDIDLLEPAPEVIPTATLSVADYSAKAGTTIPGLIADSDNVRFDINSVNVFANALSGQADTPAGIITDSTSPLEQMGIATNKIKILIVSDYDLGGEDGVEDFQNPQLHSDPSVFALNESFGYSRAKHGHIYNFFENNLFQNVELLIELEETYKIKEAKLQKSIQYIRSIDEFKAKFISELSDYNKSSLQYLGFMPSFNTTQAVRQAFFNVGYTAAHGGDYLVNRMNEVYETPTGLGYNEPAEASMVWNRPAEYDGTAYGGTLEDSRPLHPKAYSAADYSNSFVRGTASGGIMKAAFGHIVTPGIVPEEDVNLYDGSYSFHVPKSELLRSVHSDLPDQPPATALKLAQSMDGDSHNSSGFLAAIERLRTDYFAGSRAATAASIAQGQYVELLRSYIIATNNFNMTEGNGLQYAKQGNGGYSPLINDLLGDAGSQGIHFKDTDNTKKLAKLLRYPGTENTIFPFEKPSAKFASTDPKPAISGIGKWFDENIGNIFEDRPTDFRGLDTFAKEFQALVTSVETRVGAFSIEGHGQLFFNEAARAIRTVFSGELNELNSHPQAQLSAYRDKGGFDFSNYVEEEIAHGSFQPPMDPEEFEDLVDDMNDRDRSAADFSDLQQEMAELQNMITEDTVREGMIEVENQLNLLDRLQDQFFSYEGMLNSGALLEPFPGGPGDEEDFLDDFSNHLGLEDLVGVQQGLSPQYNMAPENNVTEGFVNALEEPLDVNQFGVGVGVNINQQGAAESLNLADSVSTNFVGQGMNEPLTNNADTVTYGIGVQATTQGVTSTYAASAPGYGTSSPVGAQAAPIAAAPLTLFNMGAPIGLFGNLGDLTRKTMTEELVDPNLSTSVSVAEVFQAGGLLDGENLSLAENKKFFIRKIAFIIEMLSNISALSPHQFWYLCYNSTAGEVYSAQYETTGHTFNHGLINRLLGTGKIKFTNMATILGTTATAERNGSTLAGAKPFVKQAMVAHLLEIVHVICAEIEKNMFFNIAAIADDAGLSPRSAPADEESDILALADTIFGEGARRIYKRSNGRQTIAAAGPKRVAHNYTDHEGRYTHLELRANVLLMLSHMAANIKTDLGVSAGTPLVFYSIAPKHEQALQVSTQSGEYVNDIPFSRAYVRISADVNPVAIEAMAGKLILPLVDNVDPGKGPVKWKLTYGDWASSGFKLSQKDYVNRFVLSKTLISVADEGLSAIPSGDFVTQNNLIREYNLSPHANSHIDHSIAHDGSEEIMNLVRLARHHYAFALNVGDIVPYTFVDDAEIPKTAYAISPPRGGLKSIIKGCVYSREDTRRTLAYLNRISTQYLEAKESMLALKDDPNGAELFEHAKLPGVEAQEIVKYSSLRQTFLRSFIASEEAGLRSFAYLPSSNFIHPDATDKQFRSILNKFLKINAKLTSDEDFSTLFDIRYNAELSEIEKNNRAEHANRLIEEGKIVLLGMPDGLIDTGKSNKPRDILERLVKVQEVCKHYFPPVHNNNIRPSYRDFWPGLFINRANIFSALASPSFNPSSALEFCKSLQYGTIDPDTGRYKIIGYNDLIAPDGAEEPGILETIISKKTNIGGGNFQTPTQYQEPAEGYVNFVVQVKERAQNIIFNHVLSDLLKIYLDFYAGLNGAETSYSVNLESNILYVDEITLENIDMLLNNPNIAIESADVILDDNVIVPFKEFFARQTADTNIEVAYDRYTNFVSHTQMRLLSADQMATMTLVPNIFDRTFAVYSHFGQKRKNPIGPISPFFAFPEFDDTTSHGKVGNDFNAMICYRSYSE